jgi:formylglycine-generating enzyme required for sulfatase activity
VNRDAIKVKGGSFAHLAFFLRAASVTNDLPPLYRWDNIGFRVA